mgnify:CR=1 FL=1
MWTAALLLATALAGALADEPSYKEGVRLYEQVDLDGAIKQIEGTARSMGITVID